MANCGKLHKASVWDGPEFKPHLRGSWGQGPNQHKRAVPRRGHGAKSLTQHRHAGPSANSGSVDTVPEPSGCTPLSLSSCDHRQAALSASGCECSLPEMAMKTCNKKNCNCDTIDDNFIITTTTTQAKTSTTITSNNTIDDNNNSIIFNKIATKKWQL